MARCRSGLRTSRRSATRSASRRSCRRSRLTRWLDDHRLRGGPYPLLRQLHAYYAPANFKIELVYASGRRFTLFADGTIVRDDMAVPGAWNPPGAAPAAAGEIVGTFPNQSVAVGGEDKKWARWWLFFHWPTLVDNDGTWGDPGVYSDGGVWGSNLTAEQVADLRRVPNDWHAACAGAPRPAIAWFGDCGLSRRHAGTPGAVQVGLG